MVQMNLFIKEKQTHRLREQSYGYHRERVEGRDRLEFWYWHVHSAIFKIKYLNMKLKKKK